MTVKIKRIYTKQPNEDWSGIYFNADRSKGRVAPDARDSSVYTPDQQRLFDSWFSESIYTSPGYIGVDRDYLENTFVHTIEFDTYENAMSFVQSRHIINLTTQSMIESMQSSKLIPTYTKRTMIVDEDGSVAFL